ncbi:hypothetical protein Gogos_013501 [Gossypium gossypioides]|uniref:Uncharacterized protein n=1 Tax=Gossypium gossypioides TaxID=34282 RepID=A0A7J9BVX4_GOSGO|nr:hypothetical protein [Gossypium gossypioides]
MGCRKRSTDTLSRTVEKSLKRISLQHTRSKGVVTRVSNVLQPNNGRHTSLERCA